MVSDEELRAMVREAVARHVASAQAPAARPRLSPPPPAPGHASHASHAIFVVLAGAADETDGSAPCVIEPSVPCTHCGYCQSYGH